MKRLLALLLVSAFACAGMTAADDVRGTASPTGDAATTMPSALSSAGLYNLANGYARAARPGLAVLYYERARLLDPTNADIDANLRTVQRAAALPQPAPRWYDGLARLAPPTTLAWVGFAGLIVFGMCLLAQRSRPAQRRALRFVACIGIVAMAAPLAQAWTLWPIVHSGVVIVGKAEARGSPVNLGDPAFTLPAGEEVRIAAAYRGYVLVRTRTGRSGWITAESIVPIVPP